MYIKGKGIFYCNNPNNVYAIDFIYNYIFVAYAAFYSLIALQKCAIFVFNMYLFAILKLNVLEKITIALINILQ